MTTNELSMVNQRRLQIARNKRICEVERMRSWCVRHGDTATLDAYDNASERIVALYREYYDMVALEYT